MKYANFQVLRETQNICPGVLLEVGFLSNREEAEHSDKVSSIRAYALVILSAVFKYCEYVSSHKDLGWPYHDPSTSHNGILIQ